MFLEVEAVFTSEVRTEWLPTLSSATGGNAFTVCEGGENALHPKFRLQLFEEVWAVVTPPRFGQYQDIGAEIDGFFQGPSGATPSVDTGVEIKDGNTHALNPTLF